MSDVIIVGAGQAGLALSYLLTERDVSHLVLEQARIAESWRSRRWDSLRLIGPNWTLRFPGYAYSGDDPDSFMGKEDVADHLVAYARSFGAPVQEGVRAQSVAAESSGSGFRLQTADGVYRARRVVLATGALQKPRLPACAADLPSDIVQVAAPAYRHPGALPPGAVLVVGSGQSGCQIAEELRRAGRPVYLAVSRSWWAPRRYRGRDITAWTRAIGIYDQTVDSLPPGAHAGRPSPQLSGTDGGHDISLRTLAAEGVVLLGRLRAVYAGKAHFADDLAAHLTWGDEQAFAHLRAIDEYIARERLDVLAADPLGDLRPVEELARGAPEELDLAAAGIGTVIWATGYRPELEWVGLPILDEDGYPRQRRGVTVVPGVYILGLDWLYTAGSGLFAGLGRDATYLAEIIAGNLAET